MLSTLQYPVIQAPMAGVQNSELAIAVSKAGGLGSVPAAMLGVDSLRLELQKMKSTGLDYNVNFFCHKQIALTNSAESRWRSTLMPYYEEYGIDQAQSLKTTSRQPFNLAMLELIEEFQPLVVSFHFGLPEQKLLNRVLSTGARVISSATSLREARWLQDQGIQGIIAQGLEAGGHRGHFLDTDAELQSGTFDLLAKCIDVLDVPVIAAGGLASSSDVKRAIDFGAAAVQVGTAFMLATEAKTPELHRAALLDKQLNTTLTNLFSGGLARGIENRLIEELGAVNDAAPPFPHASSALAPLRTAAEENNSLDFSPIWSGSNRNNLTPGSAEEILKRLVVELRSEFV